MIRYLIPILIIIALAVPFQALAGILSGPIVPCGIKSSDDPRLNRDCTLCDFFVMAKNIIDFILAFILIIAPVFVLVGGIVILTSAGVPDKAALGKRIITSAIIGVVIALLSWTILGMLFNTLVGEEGFPWPWNEFRCEVAEEEREEIYTYCHLQYKDQPDIMALNYDTEADCQQECPKLCDLVIPRDLCETWCCLDTNKQGQDSVCQEQIAENWCQRSAPSGSNAWILSGINQSQKGDASSALTNFLNCMYNRLPNANLTINSISSDILCSNPSCDISGTSCGHAADSCHYGGTSCTGYSYAVDFATNVSCSTIKTNALACNSSAWVNWETNHTHVSINNTACGCNEGTTPTACP